MGQVAAKVNWRGNRTLAGQERSVDNLDQLNLIAINLMFPTSQKLSSWRIFLAGLAIVFAIVAEYQNSLLWYFFQSGLFTPTAQLDRLDIDMQRGWLRSKWDSGSMYFEKVDIFGSDRVIGSLIINDDPKGVQQRIETHTFTAPRKFSWGDALLTEQGMTAHNQIEPSKNKQDYISVLVPSLGVRITTSQPELLNEIVNLRRKP